MKHGNFLPDIPNGSHQGHAVIDEQMAAMLFSYSDCVGEAIDIGGIQYIVVGVIEKPSAVIDIFGSTEQYAAYVCNDSSGDGTTVPASQPSPSSLIVKCQNGTAGMVLQQLSLSGLTAKAAINHNARAKFAVFMTRLLLLIAVCIPLHEFIRNTIRYAEKRWSRETNGVIDNRRRICNFTSSCFVSALWIAIHG